MIKFPIVFENDEILLINKPAGVSVQGGAGISHPMDEELAKQVGYKVHLVHRLDRETSGLIVVAKNPVAAKKWISLISSHQVQKEYTALCFGVPVLRGKSAQKGTITDSVTKQGREQSAVTQFTVEKTVHIPLASSQTPEQSDSSSVPPAVSELVVSQLHLVLGTGRMHQIRIHLAGAACPIVGDDKHGNFKLNKLAKKQLKVKMLCLAATKITLPINGNPRSFTVDLPAHMCFLDQSPLT